MLNNNFIYKYKTMVYKFKVKTDTLLRNLNGIKEEYKENDVIEVSTFEDYRNYINYVRR